MVAGITGRRLCWLGAYSPLRGCSHQTASPAAHSSRNGFYAIYSAAPFSQCRTLLLPCRNPETSQELGARCARGFLAEQSARDRRYEQGSGDGPDAGKGIVIHTRASLPGGPGCLADPLLMGCDGIVTCPEPYESLDRECSTRRKPLFQGAGGLFLFQQRVFHSRRPRETIPFPHNLFTNHPRDRIAQEPRSFRLPQTGQSISSSAEVSV